MNFAAFYASQMDLLLLNPYSISLDRNERRFRKPFVPLGPLYIAAYLRERGRSVSFYDATFLDPPFRPFEGPAPDWAGFYTTSVFRNTTFDLIKKAKERGINVMVGGPDASICPEDYLRAGADVAVVGEGERTTEEVMDRWGEGARGIPGTAYLVDDVLEYGPSRELIDDLDDLPLPARDLSPIRDYMGMWKRYHGTSMLNIVSSRGCPYGCKWCCRPVFGRTFRQRSVDSVLEEARSLKSTYGPDKLWFSDDVLPMRREWVRDFSEGMASEGISFDCLARVDLMDDEVARLLKRAGCDIVHLGVESGSQKVLDSMGKGTTIAQIEGASRALRATGLRQNWFLMYGYPGEGKEDILQTMRMAQRLLPDSYGISIAYPLKGTEFYEDVKDRIVGHDWDTTLQNDLVFRREYSQRFYDVARLWTHGVVRSARVLGRNPVSKVWNPATMLSARIVLSLFGGG